MVDSTGKTTQDHTAINDTSGHYYSKLCTLDQDTMYVLANAFLRNVSLPKLSTTQADKFDRPLTLDEVKKAHLLMPNNKSPGFDGCPVEFYKHIWPLLSPLFLKIISEIFHSSKVSHHLNTALIKCIPKPNRNPTNYAN